MKHNAKAALVGIAAAAVLSGAVTAAVGAAGASAAGAVDDRVAAVAARYALSPADLAMELKADPALKLTRSGSLAYADAPLASERLAGPVDAETPWFPVENTFHLHSRPASTHKIYLDFNGHTTTGTRWNSDFNNGASIVSVPFDLDGIGGFSTTERAVIQRTYLQVREDFAPFDVDVTTEDPGVEALRKASATDNAYGKRVVVSPTDSFYPNVGGVAFLNSFTDSIDTPAFVFTTSTSGSKFIGEASSHEAGHTLGLHHDGTATTTYYHGQGDWAPVLGAGYYEEITQWSKGEYTGANNTEDDLAVITTHGIGFAPDDVVATADTSATLPAGTKRYGIIGRTGDVDAYRFSLSATRTVKIRGWNNVGNGDPNLNLRAQLKTAAGALFVTASPIGDTGFTFTATLPAGSYVLYLTGVGEGSAATTGYSSYGSLGQYGVVLDWA